MRTLVNFGDLITKIYQSRRDHDASGCRPHGVQEERRQDHHPAKLPQMQDKAVQEPQKTHGGKPQEDGKEIRSHGHDPEKKGLRSPKIYQGHLDDLEYD